MKSSNIKLLPVKPLKNVKRDFIFRYNVCIRPENGMCCIRYQVYYTLVNFLNQIL